MVTLLHPAQPYRCRGRLAVWGTGIRQTGTSEHPKPMLMPRVREETVLSYKGIPLPGSYTSAGSERTKEHLRIDGSVCVAVRRPRAFSDLPSASTMPSTGRRPPKRL